MEKLLTRQEVCEYLGIGQSTLTRILADGEMTSIKFRNNVRFPESEILRYLDSCRVAPPPAARAARAKNAPGRPGRPKGSRNQRHEEPEHYYPGMKVV